MEFTQSLKCNYSASKTDRLQVELSVIYFSKHSLQPLSGISKMFLWTDHVHRLCRYNNTVYGIRRTSQTADTHSSSSCFTVQSCPAPTLPICWSFCDILLSLHDFSLPPWFTKQNPFALRPVCIFDGFCIPNSSVSLSF